MHRGCLPVSTRDYRYSWVCVTAAVWVCMQLCVCLCCGSKKRHDSTAQSRNQRQNYFGVFLVVSCTSGWSGQICNNVKQWAIKNRSEAKNTDRPVVLIFFLCVCVCVCVPWYPSCWLQAGQQLVSQLRGLFWSFPIKHDPLPLILFATRSFTVILPTTNRLLQHTVKSTPDQVEMGSHGITRWKPVNKRDSFIWLHVTLLKKGSTECYLALSHI